MSMPQSEHFLRPETRQNTHFLRPKTMKKTHFLSSKTNIPPKHKDLCELHLFSQLKTFRYT